MKLYVNYNQVCVENQEAEEEYGDWYCAFRHYFNKVSLTPNINSEDDIDEEFDVDYEVNIGDTVYVLYMEYSSGDSFGRSDGNIEIIWVFKSKELANSAKENYNAHQGASIIDCITDSGVRMSLSNPAYGYFENIENVDIKEFIVA